MKSLVSKNTTITSSYVVTNANVRGLNLKTTVTNDPKEVMSWLCFMEQSSFEDEVIGLEVQYCRQSSTNSKKPATVTLCYGYVTLLIQLSRLAEIPDQLKNLFSDKRIKFVGVNVGRSVSMLKEEYGIIVDRYEDISDIVGGRLLELELFLDPRFARKVSNLMMELVIIRKRPEIEDAVWEKEELDDGLVAYATLDSYLSYFIATAI